MELPYHRILAHLVQKIGDETAHQGRGHEPDPRRPLIIVAPIELGRSRNNHDVPREKHTDGKTPSDQNQRLAKGRLAGPNAIGNNFACTQIELDERGHGPRFEPSESVLAGIER